MSIKDRLYILFFGLCSYLQEHDWLDDGEETRCLRCKKKKEHIYE